MSNLPFSKKAGAPLKTSAPNVAWENPLHYVTYFQKKALKFAGTDVVADFLAIHSPLIKRCQKELQNPSAEEMLDYLNTISNEMMCKNPTFSATVPIALESFDTEKVEMLGSAVLVRIVNRTFLLTAAHIIDRQKDGTLLIPGKQGFMPINGSFASMRLPSSGQRDDDNFDVGYCWLDADCVANLHSDCIILERQDVSLEGKPFRRTSYTLAGFPWRKSNVTFGRITTDSYTLTGVEAQPSEYQTMKLNRSLHIAIRFRRSRAFLLRNRKLVMAPLPHGMSGGGIYVWSEDALRVSPVRLPLVGIAHTYNSQRSLLIATRLHVYVDCIFQNQPDLAAIAAS